MAYHFFAFQGAIYISTLAAERLPQPQSPPQGQTELLAASIQPIVAFMVLCSIAIHGLSIPFFSLSRRVHSVSRTWSRHDTFGRHPGLPEWANQTRQIVPGQDIVINRDLEKGQTPGTVSIADDEKTIPGVPSRRESTTVHGEGSTDAEKDGASASSQDQTQDDQNADMREEVPPDGTETVQEWREGDHRIVEKRGGPGEEVRSSVV